MPELLEILASYVPALVLRRLAKNPAPISEPVAEGFPAAVLFADISGFTALADRFAHRGLPGVEALSQLLNDYFGQLINLVYDHGGDVVKFAGDGLLALWSTEALAEDLPTATLRAAQCGLAIQQALHNAQVTPDVRLSLRIGVGAGNILTVYIGGEYRRWEMLIAGEPVITMSEAEQAASPGQVILSSQAWTLIQERAAGQPIGHGYINLKAVHAPLPPQPLPPLPLSAEMETALRPYIPGAVLSRLTTAAQAGWLAELRLVTVIFINLPNLDHRTSLERAQEIMRSLQAPLYHYEGSINKLNIDEKGATLVAALGLPPLSHENDAVLGIEAALAMRERLEEMGLGYAIGIATGRTFCGSVGSDRRREYTMVGDVVNLAARLMQAAPHDILCDTATREAAKGHFAFDELAPVTVKGKSEPVPACRPRKRPRQISSITPVLTIIGRQSEIEILSERLQSLLRGDTRGTIVVEGEAGIGKSCLLDELRHRAEAMGIATLSGAGDAIERFTPYYAWRSVYSQLLGLDPLPDLETRRQSVLVRLQADAEMVHMAPLLNVVLPLDLPENEITAQMTGQARADNTQELLVRLMLGSNGRGPRIYPRLLLLEDAHWLDSASWALALLVSRRVPKALVVIATRPLSAPQPAEYLQLLHDQHTQHLRLNPLPPQDTLSLVCQRLGVNALPPQVAALIQEKAQGNPFFSEELAYALRDAGLLLVEEGKCRLAPGAADLGELALPDTIEGVITSRIDRLGASEKVTLKVASVIGRTFSLNTLKDIYPIEITPNQLYQDIANLAQLDLVPVEGTETELDYTFKHIITQEVAYNLLPFAQRRQLHRAVAEWYERTYANDLEPYYSLLAHHWSRTVEEHCTDMSLVGRAIYYLERAGEQALRTYANQEAVDLFSRALQLDARFDYTKDRLRQARWERQRGQAYLRMGLISESRERLERTLLLLGRPMPGRQAHLIYSLAVQLLRQTSHRLRPPAPEKRPPQEIAALTEAARAYALLSEIYYFSNETTRGIYTSLRTLNLAERAGPSPVLARAYSNMCIACSVSGLDRLALAYSSRALETAVNIQDLAAQAWALMVGGLYLLGTGQHAQADQNISQAIEIWEKLGDRHRLGESMGLLAWALYFRGEFEQCRQTYQKICEAGRRDSDAQQRTWGLVGQAECLLRMDGANNADEATRLLEEALPLLSERIGMVEEIRVYGALALASLRQGNLVRAREMADLAAQHIAQFPPVAMGIIEGYCGTVEVYLALHARSQDAPAAERRQADRAAKTMCRALRRFARIFTVAQPRAWLLQGRYEYQKGRLGAAQLAWQRSLEAAQRLKMPHEEQLARRELQSHQLRR